MDNETDNFDGNTKHEVPLLFNLEQKWIARAVPHLPSYLNGYSLTWFNLPWAGLIILFGWLARSNIHWLWAMTAVLILHYLTDSLDGAVGRYRNSGFVRWGYYMDHLLDYLFVTAVIICYALVLPENLLYFLAIMSLLGTFYVNTYLAHTVTHRFKMSYSRIGPTEERIFVIILNTLMIFIGIKFMSVVIPALCLVLFIVLCITIYKQQDELIKKDRERKNNPLPPVDQHT